MKKIYNCIFAVVFSLGTAHAQFTQTDEFDYWEDQSTHSYFTTGYFSAGAYTCPGDLTLRCGNCGFSLGSAWVMLAVTPNCDSLRIDHLMAWGTNALVRVDGQNIATIGTTPGSCTWQSIFIPNATTFTADGQIVLEIADTILACDGDFQMARVKVFSNPAFPTGIISSSLNDFSLSPNPSTGIFVLDFKNDLSDVRSVSVCNAAGEIVWSTAGANKKVEIDLRGKAAGIYFLKVVDESGENCVAMNPAERSLFPYHFLLSYYSVYISVFEDIDSLCQVFCNNRSMIYKGLFNNNS
jgi:hypothetical protein